MNYKERLDRFNSTEKYNKELQFLHSLLEGKVILDYGCGLGTAMKYFHERGFEAYGYDVNDLYEWDEHYRRDVLNFKVDTVYFFHSFSHIDNIQQAIESVQQIVNPRGSVVIISPNPEWMAKISNEDYKPDPTVIKHYSLDELAEMLPFRIEQSGQFGERRGEVNERIFIKARV